MDESLECNRDTEGHRGLEGTPRTTRSRCAKSVLVPAPHHDVSAPGHEASSDALKPERRVRRGQPTPPARLYSTKISPAARIFHGALGTLAGH